VITDADILSINEDNIQHTQPGNMGILQSYSNFVLRHPAKVLIGTICSVASLLFATLLLRPLPTFKNPLVGFEARDTVISSRLNAWKLLFDETSASANNLTFSANSSKYEDLYRSSHFPLAHNEVTNPTMPGPLEPPMIEMSTQHLRNDSSLIQNYDEFEEEYYKSINSTSNTLPTLVHYSLGSSKAFCGKLYDGYAQVVIAGQNTRYSSLFNLNSMLAVCQLDRRLRLEQSLDDSAIFRNDCERFQVDHDNANDGETACCNSWSLPNYIACLNNKTSCMTINSHDMKNTEHLINFCAPFYLKAPFEECFKGDSKDGLSFNHSEQSSLSILSSTARVIDSLSQSHCGAIPAKCLKCDGWTFTVLNYLVNYKFIPHPPNNESIVKPAFIKQDHKLTNTTQRNMSPNKLTLTNVFLPIAKSSSLMKYYHTLSKHNFKTPFAHVKAMDLGLKNSMFEYLISKDINLFVITLVAILLVISIYTWSLILSLVLLLIICLSLCLSYTAYELILNIPTFPFMNLLAIVISFGICSDNAMLFCKHWTLDETSSSVTSDENSHNKPSQKEHANLNRMLRRAVLSTLIATSATACSFVISAISKVIAVRCFCIFATLSVITNYLLIVLMLPPALILDSRLSNVSLGFISDKGPNFVWIIESTQYLRDKLLVFGTMIHKVWIFDLVTKYKLYLIIMFMAVLSCSSLLVFYHPTLQPADEDEIQLLASRHVFEQYNKNLRMQFAFERFKVSDTASVFTGSPYESPNTLPIRIVFGIIPIDNGNHLDPEDRGAITFDPRFDLAEPNAQIWIIDFCHKLRQQRFVHLSSTPDLSNCFIETFKSWMETRSCRDPIFADLDRSPCCQSSEFPYSRSTFNRCIGEAINIMRKTPQFNPNLNAGVRFFRDSQRIAALVIEYQSNRLFSESYSKMEKFFNDIDEWIGWQINNTAPPSLKSGWFISSNLELLALQTELEQSTMISILLEVVFAMVALMVSTRDLILTFAGTLTIGTIIIVTVAILIALKWTLGVAESILVSLTIGLSVDFALHYSVAFSENRGPNTNHGIIGRILHEVGSPIALATITTSLAGFVIIWSDILAYQELGVFLITIAITSWITSTFFLLPMLATIESSLDQRQPSARGLVWRVLRISNEIR